jgi:GDP-4-dehydro-6-deoxy-D-mannose reductase
MSTPPFEWRGCRVLVTGASGFVGHHLARELAGRGAEVHGLGFETAAPGLPLAGWHIGELRDAASLAAALAAASPRCVVHLAGQSSAARSFEDPEGTFTLNAIGTWNLLRAVLEAAPAARTLIIGTSEVYGPQPEGTRVSEDTPFRPVSPYGLSKAAADGLARAYAEEHALDVVRTRSFGHTGPGQLPSFMAPSFAQQIATIEARRSEPVLRVGNLEVTRDLLDVRDVARAYAALLERGHAGAAYNVCRGEGVRLTALVSSFIARARVPITVEIDPARLRPTDVPYLVGDPAAIERDTGWRAGIALDQTLDDLLAEWRGRVAAG